MRRILFVAAVVCLAVSTAKAQDPVKVDPNNWKVEFENAQVRVLRVHIPPHGKLGMHDHPANVLIPLTDGHVKDVFPDGKTSERHFKAGQASWRDAVKHANENLGDTPMESILVELKGMPAAADQPADKLRGQSPSEYCHYVCPVCKEYCELKILHSGTHRCKNGHTWS